jgi:hypothetical protein
VDGDGTLYLPEGTTVSGGLEASYLENEDGTFASVGVEGSVSNPAYGSAGGAVGYTHIDSGDVEIDTVHAEGYAQGFGTQISGEVDYAHAETPEGEFSSLSGDVDVDGPGGLWAEDASPAAAVPAPGSVADEPGGLMDTDTLLGAARDQGFPVDDILAGPPGISATKDELGEVHVQQPPVETPAHDDMAVPIATEPVPASAPEQVLVEPEPALAPPPSDFTAQVEAADQVEESLDDMFEGLQ